MDPDIFLPNLAEHGFSFTKLPGYSRSVAAVRDGFAVLLSATPEGTVSLTASGYLAGERIAILVESPGGPVFQAKDERITATEALMESYRRFQADLKEAAESSRSAGVSP